MAKQTLIIKFVIVVNQFLIIKKVDKLIYHIRLEKKEFDVKPKRKFLSLT